MKYEYLYQDSQNNNCCGSINARNRADAYAKIRRLGIKPYRVLGDDPWNWRPFAYGACLVLAVVLAIAGTNWYVRSYSARTNYFSEKSILGEAEKADFRRIAADFVEKADPGYKYSVWLAANSRLKELGIEPLEKPEGMETAGDLHFLVSPPAK